MPAAFGDTDVDIMGIQRGAHKDGPEKCKQFKFHPPGGPGLWGWNDARGAFCAICKERDIDHIVLFDPHSEANKRKEEERIRKRQEKLKMLRQPRAGVAATLTSSPAADAAMAQRRSLAAIEQSKMSGMLSDAIDPIAIAGRAAAPLITANDPFSIAAAGAAPPRSNGYALPPKTAPMPSHDDEAPPQMMATTIASSAPATVAEFLGQLGLSEYAERFEQEQFDMSTLSDLASGEGKAALDEALKEVGVASIGHRLKIFSGLQASGANKAS